MVAMMSVMTASMPVQISAIDQAGPFSIHHTQLNKQPHLTQLSEEMRSRNYFCHFSAYYTLSNLEDENQAKSMAG